MPKAIKVLLSLVLLSLLGLAAFFIAQKASEENQSWSPAKVKPFKNWFQINWHNQAVGWASLELKRTDKLVSITEEDFIIGRVQAQPMEFRFKRVLEFSAIAPYQLVSINIHSQEPRLEVAKEITNTDMLNVIESRNGEIKTSSHKLSTYNLGDYLALRSWVRQAKSRSKALIIKEFNNDDYGVHYSRYELLNSPNSSNSYYKVKHQLQNTSDINDSYQSEPTILSFDQEFNLVKQSKVNGMTFVASEGRVTINPEMQRDLYIGSGIEVDKPLGKVATINQLQLLFPNQFLSEFKNHPVLDANNGLLTLRKGYSYQATSTPKTLSSHAKATRLALQIVNQSDPTVSKIKSLTKFVYDYIDYQTLPSSFQVDDILKDKIGDCTEHALLLVEMLNGVGIPAREVSGLIYLGDDKQRFGGHVWVEAFYDDKWHAVDPTWNLTTVTAAHIPLMIGANKAPKILQNPSNWQFLVNSIE